MCQTQVSISGSRDACTRPDTLPTDLTRPVKERGIMVVEIFPDLVSIKSVSDYSVVFGIVCMSSKHFSDRATATHSNETYIKS